MLELGRELGLRLLRGGELARMGGGGLLGCLHLAVRELRLRARLLDLRLRLGGRALGGGAGLGGRQRDLLAGGGLLALDRRAGGVAGGLDRLLGALGGGLGLLARGLALGLGAGGRLLGLRVRGADLGLRALGAGLRVGAQRLDRALGVARGPLGLAARRRDLAIARGDGGLELLARRALGGDALVELGARRGDLVARAVRGLLGGGPRLLEERDALAELDRLALAAARGRLGLGAQADELVAGLARRALGGRAGGALGLQARLERGHRLAALLGGALGVLAAPALLAQDGRVAPARVDRGRDRDRLGRRRLLGLRGAPPGLRRARQIDDAAARLQRERDAAGLEQRGGRRERGAPLGRVGTGLRGGVVGARQRRDPARALPVVEDQDRRREALALLGAPMAGDAQEDRARPGRDALEAIDFEIGSARAHDRGESKSARASSASLSRDSSLCAASSTRMRRGSRAARSS